MSAAEPAGQAAAVAAAPVTYATAEGVAVVTLNRPERRNAWTAAMQQAYRAAMGRAERDPDARAVVVTGAGSSFCVGGDMETLATLGQSGSFTEVVADPRDDASFGSDLGSFAFVLRMSKPVIAAINGAAAGVGFILACFCDIRVLDEEAKFTTGLSRLGLPAEQGLSWILPRLVGLGPAIEVLFESPVVRPDRALKLGLVNDVAPAGQALHVAMERAKRLASEISPASLRMMKQQVHADLRRDLPEAIADAGERAANALNSPDYREGVAAFRERRPPRFAVAP